MNSTFFIWGRLADAYLLSLRVLMKRQRLRNKILLWRMVQNLILIEMMQGVFMRNPLRRDVNFIDS
ncbi:hypothetical protein CJT82_06680 [Pseudomonas aeruginosa]|nr:hypothetical protein APA64_15265 [Pseudomonas aeruginosa]PBX25716.1 hypothetical protein CJT83_06215 [Pseudomonas aeruginosa]PBX31706.1 hypothetical protein CJT82_06680 [Pseudomonas aeruginosa]RIY90656.1 hypothetical protein AXW92_23510 [Pseudomonas aeruginosa]RPM23725.1 hypothetical protein IPC1294_31995 [Pseudomonas aeruginosa]